MEFELLRKLWPSTIDEYATSVNLFPDLEKAKIQYARGKRKIDKYDAIIVTYRTPWLGSPTKSFFTDAFLVDSTGRVWRNNLLVQNPPNPDLEMKFTLIFDAMLNSFKILEGPAEAQKSSGSAGSERVTIRLKPEELFRALLTTPFQPNELPAGFTAKGKQAGTLDATAQALKAIGQVNVLVVEADPRLLGMPSGGISYTVFPNASGAKDAYNMFAKRPDSRTISDSPYPTAFLIEQSLFAKVNLCVVLVDNTFIAATLTSMDQAPREGQTIQLTQAGVRHLQKVGR